MREVSWASRKKVSVDVWEAPLPPKCVGDIFFLFNFRRGGLSKKMFLGRGIVQNGAAFVPKLGLLIEAGPLGEKIKHVGKIFFL